MEWNNMGGVLRPGGTSFVRLDPGAYESMGAYGGHAIKPHKINTDQLIVLEDSPVWGVIRNIRSFWAAKTTYRMLGMLHKRGAILEGPPGSGKTAAIGIITQDVVKQGGIVLVGHRIPDFILRSIGCIREVERERPMVVIMEDLEDLLNEDERTVLSLLDGENQVENVVYLATSNHIAQIPDRIKNRPSRFDEVVHLGMPSYAVRLAFLQSKAGQLVPAAKLEDWAKQSEGFAIAHLRELLLGIVALGRPIDEVFARLAKMIADADEAAESEQDKTKGLAGEAYKLGKPFDQTGAAS